VRWSAWKLLVRTLALTAGRAALQRALPLYLGLAILAAITFGGNGLQPMTVTAQAESSWVVRATLYLGWIIATLPAIRAVLTTPETFFLRSLPVGHLRILAILITMLALVELPWTALWAFGAGAVAASGATLAALAGSSVALLGFERRTEWLLAAVVVIALFGFSGFSGWALLGVAAPAAAVGIWRAWRWAPELSRGRARAWVRGPALVALTASYLVVLHRRSPVLVFRALCFTALAIGAGSLAIHNLEPGSSQERYSLALICEVPALAFGLAGLTGPLLRTEAQLAWLTAVCGTPLVQRRLAVLLACGAWALTLGLAYGLAVGSLLRLRALALGELSLYAAAMASIVSLSITAIARWALRGDGRDAMRLILAVGALSLLMIATLRQSMRWSLLTWALLAIVASLRLSRQPSPATRHGRTG
jgi:hypothetical protein